MEPEGLTRLFRKDPWEMLSRQSGGAPLKASQEGLRSSGQRTDVEDGPVLVLTTCEGRGKGELVQNGVPGIVQ